MKKERLHLYRLDVDYANELGKVDYRIMSISPQAGKDIRPFIGIVVQLNGRQYCIPLTSPKPKHRKMKNDLDFLKILDKHGNILGALNFNNMIPVTNSVITRIKVNPEAGDTPEQSKYKNLLVNQLDWCNDNANSIIKKAQKLYRFITESPEKFQKVALRCCDFKKLEMVLDRYTAIQRKLANEQYISGLPDDEVHFIRITDQELHTLQQNGSIPFISKKEAEDSVLVKIALKDKESVQTLLAHGNVQSTMK